MEFLPLFLKIAKRPVLVVGGGPVAARKIALLRRAGARVTVVAPMLVAPLRESAARGELAWHEREFVPGDVDGVVLAIAATGVPAVDEALADAARARGVFANVVDRATLGDAVFPAIVDRSPVIVAIGTGATAPTLAVRVRGQVEALLDASLGPLARLAARFRGAARALLPNLAARRRFWNTVFDGPVARAVARGSEREAEALLRQALRERATSPARGHVSLVGAGPGDPGLLTLHALRALQAADVVLYDRLVSPAVLELARRDAEFIAVGKRHGEADAIQSEILELMREHTLAGQRVVRLKGGDPLLFARGGEELAFLREHGIAYDIVPGVTAALACAAYAGIPLTERGVAAGVRFATATPCAFGAEPDWHSLARNDDTLVLYMGVARAGLVSARLTAHGRAADTPVAIVERGSTPEQRVVVTRLDRLDETVREHAIVAPSLLVIGALASRALDLAWFGALPIDATREGAAALANAA